MKTYGTYFQNDSERPICYGEVNLINPPRRRLKGEEAKEGITAYPVFCGFCGTDHELMRMGRDGKLKMKFPEGENRLINGHEGCSVGSERKPLCDSSDTRRRQL